MIKSAIKKFTKSCLFGLISANLFCNASAITIVLDPGHGGPRPGCVRQCEDREILEKDLNYTIASEVKKLLSGYVARDGSPVEVYLTHNNLGENPSLQDRVNLGVAKDADVVISLHINASENKTKHGSMVLTTYSHYNDLYEKENALALCFLSELSKLGLAIPGNASGTADDGSKITITDGVMRRTSTDGSVYANGDIADYYGIICNGVESKIPAIIVEHAYLSNDTDYQTFLSDDAKLAKLSAADVDAIVKHFDLVESSDLVEISDDDRGVPLS